MFLRITITDDKKLAFNFFHSDDGFFLELDEMSFIMNTANNFLPKAIKDEEDFNEWANKK